MFKIVLREFRKSGPNGDRSTHNVPYSDYKVVLISPKGAEEVLQEFGGFDSWWSAPKDTAQVRKEAEKYLKAKAKFFDATELPVEVFKPKPVVAKQEWVRA